jgi:serine/threonine-protein kinase
VTSPTSPTERVGRYQLLEPIGIGPSGTVSRAKVFGVAGFERQFAVKRFHAELTSTAAMAAMLSAAARAYGSLEHPRIARMSEFGVAQGATFTAVEYVVGLDALRLVAEARLTGVSLAAGGALALVSQAARAVGYAHGRGLTHLGLAPTNVIITAEGDIKITDFGILSATLAQRPTEVPRLANRIAYLAPEQLANEATSAATDVFALGVLAYELVTGERTFRGDSPQQVAAQIMAGPPAEPALPRPIVRVLQRCLARSPFERFPDARALADALDAALRVAPVPGTRRDIGAQVKDTLDRMAALNEGQASGVVALFAGTGPIPRHEDLEVNRAPTVEMLPGPPLGPPPPAYTVSRPELPSVPPLNPGASATMPDVLPRPMTTVPGLPPPPIPVPPGIAGGSAMPPGPAELSNPSGPSGAPGAGTLLGMGKAPTVIPTIRPKSGSSPGLPPRPSTPPTQPLRGPNRVDSDLAIPIQPASPSARIQAATDATSQASRDSAIHTLDPNDILSYDANDDDEAPALEAPPPRPAQAPPPIREIRPRPPARVDQNTVDTQPITPIVLEPLLFDPISRSEPVPVTRPDERAEPDPPARPDHPGDPAEPSDDESPDDPRESARTRAIGSFGPTPTPSASPLSKTMLGFASPLPRAPAPPARDPGAASAPVAPEISEADPAGDDDLSAMLNEGFVSGPPAVPAWPLDGNTPPGMYAPGSPMVTGPLAQASEGGAGSELDAGPPALAQGWPAPPSPSRGNPAESLPIGSMRRPVWIAVGVLGAAIVGISLWQVFRTTGPIAPVAPVAKAPIASAPPVDARVPVAAPGPADAARAAANGPAAIDAGAAIALAPSDARIAAPVDAGRPDAAALATIGDAAAAGIDAGAPRDAATAAAPSLAPTAPGQALAIASTPPGARVFLDGADTGATPLSLPGSPDRHTIALLLAGYELYLAQVDGHGTFQIPLKEVTPTNGPAGIKVLRCKDKDRYYVSVDGKPTGQTCPTERIGCDVGPHTVEVYDVVSETRRKWDIVVKDTRLSFRVRVE